MVQRRSKSDFGLGIHTAICPHLIGCGYARRLGLWEGHMRLHENNEMIAPVPALAIIDAIVSKRDIANPVMFNLRI